MCDLIDPDFENPGLRVFFSFSPSETGGFCTVLLDAFPRSTVQSHCIPLQNFALCEMADQPQRPTARLGLKAYCTASRLAKKTDAKPVGGRGISAFPRVFLFLGQFSHKPGIT